MTNTKTHPALEALRGIVERSHNDKLSGVHSTVQALNLQSIRQEARAAIPQLEALLAERAELFDAATELLALIDDSLDYCADSGPNFPMRLSQETGRLQAAVDACEEKR